MLHVHTFRCSHVVQDSSAIDCSKGIAGKRANKVVVRVLSVEPQAMHEIAYRCTGTGKVCRVRTLTVLRGQVDVLPAPLQGLILTSDLQGMGLENDDTGLLGEVLAEELADLSDQRLLPPRSAMGDLFAGDLYSTPEATGWGVSGDVWPVCGPLENGSAGCAVFTATTIGLEQASLPSGALLFLESGLHFLDADQIELDGLHVTGVGGIIGKPGRAQRHAEAEQRTRVQQDLERCPGPPGGSQGAGCARVGSAKGEPCFGRCSPGQRR